MTTVAAVAPPPAPPPPRPVNVDVMVQGVTEGLDRADGEYDSHELGRKDAASLLQLLETLAALEPLVPGPDDDFCPAALFATDADDEMFSFTCMGQGRLYACEAEAEVAPAEALQIVAGTADTQAMLERGDEQRRARELAARSAAGIFPVRFGHLPPTNHRTTSAETIDRGPGAPHIVMQVSTEKLFGGKRWLRIGFCWKTNTLWVDHEGSELHFIGDANMIVRFGMHKNAGEEIDGGMISDVVVMSDATWTVLAERLVLPGLPSRRTVFEFRKRKEAEQAKSKLAALLSTQR